MGTLPIWTLPVVVVVTASTSILYLRLVPDMSNQEAFCYTVVYEDSSESPSTQDLRTALQKGTDDVKLDTLRKIIVSTINGNPQASRLVC